MHKGKIINPKVAGCTTFAGMLDARSVKDNALTLKRLLKAMNLAKPIVTLQFDRKGVSDETKKYWKTYYEKAEIRWVGL